MTGKNGTGQLQPVKFYPTNPRRFENRKPQRSNAGDRKRIGNRLTFRIKLPGHETSIIDEDRQNANAK
jgi:hypothetical protein